MIFNSEQIKALVYLWSRDAGINACVEAEVYLAHQLKSIQKDNNVYSDTWRAMMVDRIMKEVGIE